MLHLATSALAFRIQVPAGSARMHAPRAVISPQMSLVDSLKESVVPANQDKTLRNAVGYQALAWGIAGIAAPAFVQSKFLGVTATATTNTLVRGLGWSNLALAGRITSGSDSDAATTGVIWFSLWCAHARASERPAASCLTPFG